MTKRGLTLIAALGLVAALAAGLVVATSPRQPATAQDAAAVTVQRAHAGSATPTLKRRVVLLTIGSDSGAPKFGRGGAAESGRADALQLVIIDTAKRKGAVVSFPRDSYVPIPGHGTNKINAAGGEAGWDGLIGLFDKPVRASARKQLDALSLGADARKVSAIRPSRASARAVVLYGEQRPAAATVRLAFDGTADTAQGSGPVHLRSVLQLLATGEGWRIAAFDSRTGPPR